MVFMLVTALVSAVAIFLGSSLLGWILKKVAPGAVANLGHVVTVGTVVVTTAAWVYIATRPSIVGPYEQWTFENIGGQIIGGVLVVGIKTWMGSTAAVAATENAQ